MKNIKHLAVMIALFCLISVLIPAHAQSQEYVTSYQPIRKVNLGVTSLTLEAGEKYTFSVSFDPEDPPITKLTWFNTDNTVAAVNQLTNTVTALTPGTTRLMAESFDKEAYAVCEITVNGMQEKDISGMLEGKALLTLSAEDRSKIKASQINRYLDLLEMSVFTEETLPKLLNRSMQVMAEVRPGTEEAESERALALGMVRAYPMKHLHLVSLHGSFEQILDFVRENENLIRIFKGHDIYIFDPFPKTSDSPLQPKAAQGSNTTMLEGKVEELTSVSTMHKLGYTGKGTTIAIVDTGLNRNHEQYAGRVIHENCFSWSWNCKRIQECEPCDMDDPECDPFECYDCDNNIISSCEGGSVENYGESYSAFPGGAKNLSEFDHGSHVAGIAAGKDGMAPDAQIVAAMVQSEFYSPTIITDDNPDGYTVTLWNHDIYSAYDWLLDLQEEMINKGETPISFLNLSLGGGQYTDYCDDEASCADEYYYFQYFTEEGILPVAASGNEYLDDAVSSPGCLSNGLTVGALAAMDKPYISCFSNHNQTVDILAPGSNLWSSYLTDPDGNPGTNTYGRMSGTSMATPAVTGSLALINEAFPGKTVEEYRTILVDMSEKTADRRNSSNRQEFNLLTDDGTGTVFPFTKPVLDFSGFAVQTSAEGGLVIDNAIVKDSESEQPITEDGNAIVSDITTENITAISAVINEAVNDHISTDNVTAEGEDANGIDAIVSNKDGSLTLMSWGDVEAGNAGIVIYKENKGPLNIFVEGKVRGDTVGVLVSESIAKNALSADNANDFLDSINITVGEIVLNDRKNAAEYETGGKAAEVEKDINYIIRADQPENGEISVVDGEGNPWTHQNFGYNTAKLGETVYFKVTPQESEDFDPEDYEFQMFDRVSGERLLRTNNGLFLYRVHPVWKNGGPLHVYAKAVRKPQPSETRSIELYRITGNFGASGMPKTGFSAIRPQNLSEQPLRIQYNPTSLTIQLPKLDVESDIVTVPYTDGAYPVEWLGSAVGMLEGSSLPGEGITVLTGHNHLNTTEAGPFALLRELEAGDSIMITDQRGIMQTWHVYKSEKIPADGFAGIAGDVKENALVLITCEDEAVDGGYLNRRVILAEM